MALNADSRIFIVYLASLAKPTIIPIYSFYKAQVALLISAKIYTKYFDFLNIFSSDSAAKLSEYTGINNYSINLLKDK